MNKQEYRKLQTEEYVKQYLGAITGPVQVKVATTLDVLYLLLAALTLILQPTNLLMVYILAVAIIVLTITSIELTIESHHAATVAIALDLSSYQDVPSMPSERLEHRLNLFISIVNNLRRFYFFTLAFIIIFTL